MAETSAEVRRRLRRAKDSERRGGKWLLAHDGPDSRFRPGAGLVTTTGRVGHVTGLQFDLLSKSYAGENKQMKVWAGLWKFWKQIAVKAVQNGKEPLLRIEPTNEDDVMEGVRIPVMHIITEDRHAQLLGYERQVLEGGVKVGIDLASGPDESVVVVHSGAQPQVRPVVRPYSKAQQAGRGRRK